MTDVHTFIHDVSAVNIKYDYINFKLQTTSEPYCFLNVYLTAKANNVIFHYNNIQMLVLTER